MPARGLRSPTGEPCAYLVSYLRPRHNARRGVLLSTGLGAFGGLIPREVGLTLRSSNFRRFSQLNPIRAYLHQSLLPCFPSIGSNLCCRSFPGVGSLGLGGRDIAPRPRCRGLFLSSGDLLHTRPVLLELPNIAPHVPVIVKSKRAEGPSRARTPAARLAALEHGHPEWETAPP